MKSKTPKQLPLEDIKVADFSWVGAGPWTVKYLADHGAQVIHIESNMRIDLLRVTPPYRDNQTGLNRSGYFSNYNENKYGISLNLNHPRGSEVAKRIVAWADVVVESFGPGRMKKWGLDYEELRKLKPDIIMLSSTQMGQTGPASPSRAAGTQLVGLSGFIELTGWADCLPSTPYGAYTDAIAPRFGAVSILAALDYRRRTGKGQYLDLSQYETALHFIAPLFLDYTVNGRIATRTGNKCSYAAPHGVYPCRGNDRWCALAIFTDKEWEVLTSVMKHPRWVADPKFATILARKNNEDELDKLIGVWTVDFIAEELMTMLQGIGIRAGVVEDMRDIHYDAQLKHRHHFWELDHPVIGKHRVDAPPVILSKTPRQLNRAAPCLGQDNYYVYTHLLGMSEEEFVQLLEEGVLE